MKNIYQNLSKMPLRSGVFFVIFSLFVGNLAYGQIHKEFTPRAPKTDPEKKFYNIKGDFAMLGNTNLTLADYDLAEDNSGNQMQFVDIDSDPNTINSSSANLIFDPNLDNPNCSNIVWAGLYWAGRAGPNEGNFLVEVPNATVPPFQVQITPTNSNLVLHNGGIANTPYIVSVYDYTGTGSNNSNRTSTVFYRIDLGNNVYEFTYFIGGGTSYNTNTIQYRVNGGAFQNVPIASTNDQNTNFRTATFSNNLVLTGNGNNGGNITLTVSGLRRDRRHVGGTNSRTLSQQQDVSGAIIAASGFFVSTTGTKTLDKRVVKLKVPGSANYINVQAQPGDIFYSVTNDSEFRQMYAGFADVTEFVKDLPNAGLGTYTVADIATIDALSDGTGNFGGWGMVVIYENSDMKWKDITVFDGYAHVSGPNAGTWGLDIDGFRAAQDGPVEVKLGVMAGEGDRNISGDQFAIKFNNVSGDITNNAHWFALSHGGNTSNNFFNSSIETGGNTRNLNRVNNTGIDISTIENFNVDGSGNNIYIDNNDTATKFRYRSTGDTYAIFNIVFAVDSYVPEVEPNNTLVSINGNPVANQHAPGLEVDPNDVLVYKLDIRNIGTEAINNAIVEIPMPYAGVYVSSNGTTNGFSPVSPPSFNPVTGLLTWNLGTLPLPDPDDPNDILATLNYTIRVTDDCFIIANASCAGFILVDGTVNGTGAITGATLGDAGDFIFGFNDDQGECEGSPITDPTPIAIDPTNANCTGDEEKIIIFCENEVQETIPVSTIRNQFPAGTQFWSGIDLQTLEGTGTLFNNATPFPATPGQTTYYGIPPSIGGSICYFEFIIEVTDIEGTPIVDEDISYCIGEQADLLSSLAEPSQQGYQLFFYETIDSQTPLDVSELRPSTASAGTVTYYVAQGTPTCIGERVPIVIEVVALPILEITNPAAVCAPGTVDLTADAVTDGSDADLIFTYWTDLDATQTLANPESVSISGTYYIKAENAAGCFVVKPVVVVINALPDFTVTPPAPVCFPFEIDLATTHTSVQGAEFTYWRNQEATIPSTQTVGESGTYFIKATLNGCEVVKSVDLIVTPATEITTQPVGATYCIDATATALTASASGTEPITYEWFSN
ncbi:autotransporter outer membrane beta-barrel domain-containing protein, partial [Algoriphagus taiwanensis]